MLTQLTLVLSLAAFAPTAHASAFVQSPTAEQTESIRAADKDVKKLLELARAWMSATQEDAARAAFTRVLELDPKNEEAHKGLRHHFYDGRWFETYTELAAFRRAEDERMLKEKGLVRFRDQWVKAADKPYLEFGFEKDEAGNWISSHTKARLAREKDLAAKGWQPQDLTWIPPEEFDAWKQGLWKCDKEWFTPPEADTYHAEVATWWQAPSEHFIIYSTCARAEVEWVKWWADHTWDDLVRIFGVEPGIRATPLDLLGEKRNKPGVVCLRSLAQYNEFAAGSTEKSIPATEQEGFSSLHYAYFAEAWFDQRAQPPLFRGSGVAFWDKNDKNLNAYGQHAIRHAAAQSFVEALDPSWKALGGAASGGLSTPAFWAEKQIPRWLRYGAASYAERYFVDATVGADGNRMWAREWAMASLKAAGGMRPIDSVFSFALSLDDIAGSTKLIHEAGLLVAYMLDGNDKPVQEAHEAFKAALKQGEGVPAAAKNLQAALKASEPAIKKFAGM